MNDKLLKPYNPQDTEQRIYKLWEESGYFNPDVCIKAGITSPQAPVFSMIMPPPNVTGVLHMGHGLMITIEDILVRFNRMRGKRTLWIPGTDHAAIATQSRVEKEISKKEGKSRYDIGREELLRRIEAFAQESHDTIVSQIKRTGASCDWSREAFTLDEQRSFAVRTMFKHMYDDGLIYRGNRIVNWDPKGQTTISDDEIVYEERQATLYTFTYSKDFPVAISTTRPETKVGDVAVAVHPEDSRYTQYVGKEYDTTFCGVPIHIKIIADASVDKEFGTGALGVTPAHSMIDWDIAQKHNLPLKQVINEHARMIVGDERLMNKKTTEARTIIVEWLKSEGLLIKEETITQNVSTAERTGGIVEPLPKLQWFIAVNKPLPSHNNKTLKELMAEPVTSGTISIIPDHFSKTYFNWINNLRDWCISRQIWYGHRIPVWYRDNEIYCDTEAPKADSNGEWKQDEDTLDTWFSSGLWTFSTLGWPAAAPRGLGAMAGTPHNNGAPNDLEIYHPTNVLETGYEILFFWVARMILMTQYALKTIPFKTVYLHGTVRDGQGRKMSKSLGNGIDPIEIADTFGADAGRMALIVGSAPGTDSKIDTNKVKGYKNFANKIWNITRFILSNTINTDTTNTGIVADPQKITTEADKALLKEFNDIAQDITNDIETYRLHLASEKIYHYIWHRFADIILEESKPILSGTDVAQKISRQHTLLVLLKNSLIILHPFMPFVTEELWSMIPHTHTKKTSLLMVESWIVS